MSDDLLAAEALEALRGTDAPIEYKSNLGDFNSAVLDVSSRDVTTLFSVDCLDSVGDITPTSAFRMVTKARPETIPHLFMHDLNSAAIAVMRSFQELTRADLPEDVQREHPDATGGMACVSTFLTTPRGDEIFQGIKAGIPYQASFGYTVKQATPHKSIKAQNGKPARMINQLWLHEVSTTHPNHAAQRATRVRLGKALALLEEYKAGRRHGETDMAMLRQMALALLELGADNIQLIETARPPAGISPASVLINEITTLLGGHDEVSLHGAT
jgi:phage head maturation protease